MYCMNNETRNQPFFNRSPKLNKVNENTGYLNDGTRNQPLFTLSTDFLNWVKWTKVYYTNNGTGNQPF